MSKYNSKARFFITLSMALTFWISSGRAEAQSQSASGSAPKILEIVQSVPLETTLAVPGIRHTQEVWLEMIQSAKTHIDFEQFYIAEKSGESLSPVLKAIREAALRGVKIRFLVDSKFFAIYPETIRQLGQISGIQAAVIDYSKYGGVQHAKFFVIDHKLSFVGSPNFDWRALNHIHEVGVRIEDPSVAQSLESIFEEDWNQSSLLQAHPALATRPSLPHSAGSAQKKLPPPPSRWATVDATPEKNIPSGIEYSADSLGRLIRSAQKQVKIQVYQYALKDKAGQWTTLDTAIRQAAARKVQVQLLVDAVALKKAAKDLRALAKIPQIEVRTIRIPAWSGGPMEFARLAHSKYIVVDQAAAWVGSANWSGSYFLDTRNVGLVTQDPHAVKSLHKIFDRVWESSYVTALPSTEIHP